MENQTLQETGIKSARPECVNMCENQLDKTQFERSSSLELNEEDFRRSVEAEIIEMEKYKWCLGVSLRHDPLQDRSLNDIYFEWIDKYASDFRKHWQNRSAASNGTTPA
jgi:hypothetical protein